MSCLGKIMADDQIREDQIMGRIEGVAKEDEEGWEKMKEEIKAEMKASEARVLTEVEIMEGVVELLRSSAFLFAIDPLAIDPQSINVASDPIVVSPSTNPTVDLP